MSRTARRIGVIALAAAGIAAGTAATAPGVASADEQVQEPCYIHGSSEPFGTCIVRTVLEKLPPIS